MTQNEHVYTICFRSEVAGDVISDENIKSVEGYDKLAFEAAIISSFREIKISHQVEFRKNRSCADPIITSCISLEQSLENNSPLYVDFIDCVKAITSVNRCLWKLLMHYGIHEKITSIIQNSYEGRACSVVHTVDSQTHSLCEPVLDKVVYYRLSSSSL